MRDFINRLKFILQVKIYFNFFLFLKKFVSKILKYLKLDSIYNLSRSLDYLSSLLLFMLLFLLSFWK